MLKKFICDRCGKNFSRKHHYKTHETRINRCISINNPIISKIFNKTPLRYKGSKVKNCFILDNIISKYINISNYTNIISPFFGGGSFEFYLQSSYNLNIIANDNNLILYYFWLMCKNEKKELCNLLFTVNKIINKNKFLYIRKHIKEINNPFMLAIYYFILNRCSFNGLSIHGGYCNTGINSRFTIASIEKINNLDLSSFNITNTDYEVFINNNIHDKNLIFLDPPYYIINNKFDHQRLYNCLSTKSNWILIYNDCEFIKALYKNYKIINGSILRKQCKKFTNNIIKKYEIIIFYNFHI